MRPHLDPLSNDMQFLAQLVCGALGSRKCGDAQVILKDTVNQATIEMQAIELEIEQLADPKGGLLTSRLEGIRKRLELAAEGGDLLAVMLRALSESTLQQAYTEYRARAASEVQHA